MIKRATELLPSMLIDELLRMARIDRDWCQWSDLGDGRYNARSKVSSFVSKIWGSGADAFAMWAASIWLVDGPKIFTPTVEQCKVMEQIEVNITLEDYAQPYPALLVNLPLGMYEPFRAVLCHHSDKLLTCVSHSHDSHNDITTTIAKSGVPIENSLKRYDEDCIELGAICMKGLRVAVNSCLALTNFGCLESYMFPQEVERDKRLAGERSQRGTRAGERLNQAPLAVKFERDIVLHTQSTHDDGSGEHSSGEKAAHWRRGHWAMQACGPNHSLRKMILRRPVLVRADKLTGEISETTTRYKT